MTDEAAEEKKPEGNPPAKLTWCCKMREKHVVSIVAVDNSLPDPVDIIDFLDFTMKTPKGNPIIYMAYCPWCGTKLPRDRRRLIDLASDDEGEEWKKGTAD